MVFLKYLEGVAILQLLPECPYVHFKHVEFYSFLNIRYDTLQVLMFVCHNVSELRFMDIVILVSQFLCPIASRGISNRYLPNIVTNKTRITTSIITKNHKISRMIYHLSVPIQSFTVKENHFDSSVSEKATHKQMNRHPVIFM